MKTMILAVLLLTMTACSADEAYVVDENVTYIVEDDTAFHDNGAVIQETYDDGTVK